MKHMNLNLYFTKDNFYIPKCLYLQHGFKTFLGIAPQVAGWNSAGDEFSLVIENNPLAEFVELPEGRNNLWYSSILIGVIKGALEMVSSFLNFFTLSVMSAITI